MSWIPFKIGQPKKQIVSKTVERDFEREYEKLQKLEDQTKKLHKDMKKSTEADLAMSKAAVKISGDLLSNPLCEQDQAFLDSMTALDTAMKRMDSFNQEKVNQIQKTVIDPLKNPFFLLVCSGGGAMTGWNGSNFLFLVGGRRTCGRAHNMAKGPASWAQSRGLVEEENYLIFVHSAGSESDIMVFISELSEGDVKRDSQPPRPRESRPDLGCYFHLACSPHPDLSHGQWWALGPRAALNRMSKAVYVLVCHRYSGVFPSLNMAVKRREQALQDYKRLQSKVEKYEEKEKTGPVMVKLHQAREELRPVREDFDVKNKQLLDEMPKFYHSRIDYFQPSFEALIRAQVVYFTEMYTIFSDLTDQIDQAGLTDEQRERETEAKLSELRALSIVADD
ncbi:hypothetical protein NQZ68_027836 [Dissostichus eleginoides]|nr:hypothetical protein NQZ68_027836 [Dissostichus eleginoides]